MYKMIQLLAFMYNFLKHAFNKKLDKPMSELCVYEIYEWKTQTHQVENAQFEQNRSLHVSKNLKFHLTC